jgi:hypothetical protein
METEEDILTIILLSVLAYGCFFMGQLSGEKKMRQQAIQTHNAHYVLNETNGTSVFTWN